MSHSKFGLILVICVLLYSVGVYAQDSDIQDKKVTVHGYITDTTAAQLPIAGVRVQIDNMRGHFFLTKSGETGEFIYRDIPAGDYVINFRKAGYQSRIGLPVSVTNGESRYVPLTMNKKRNIFTGFQNIFGSKELQGGTLQLQITTQFPPPTPIDNAEVKIRQIDGGVGSDIKIKITGTSDTNGQYRRDNLLSGVYIVTVGKVGYHRTSILMTFRENRITTASVKLSIADGISDTNILPLQKINTNWVIRGKIFDTNFQQTPVSDVKVRISGVDLEQSMDSLSNADGEYEFVLLPGHYMIFLYKDGYRKTTSLSKATAESRQSSVTVLEEGMFVVYEAVAKGNVLELKHGISKEQRSFYERYRDKIWLVHFSLIIGFIAFFFVRYLNKRQQEYSQE